MANVPYGDLVFGLFDLKAVNMAGTLQVDFGASQKLMFSPQFVSGIQRGDDRIHGVVSFVEGAEAEVTYGRMSTEALALVTGKTLTTTGSSPNEKTTYKLNAGDAMPPFKLYGKARGENGSDVHYLIKQCVITSGLELTSEGGGFVTPGFKVQCIADTNGDIIEIAQNETAANLPTS